MAAEVLDVKARLGDAVPIVDALPWRVGRSPAERKLARGRAAILANHVASLLASGWTVEDVRAVLGDAPAAVTAPDPAAQERLWRGALKRAKNARQRAERLQEEEQGVSTSSDLPPVPPVLLLQTGGDSGLGRSHARTRQPQHRPDTCRGIQPWGT